MRLHIRYTVDTVVEVEDPEFILSGLQHAKDNPEDCSEGVLAAFEKLHPAADEKFKMFTLVAEVTSEIIKHEVLRNYPVDEGVACTISSVSYEETPERAVLDAAILHTAPVTLQ